MASISCLNHILLSKKQFRKCYIVKSPERRSRRCVNDMNSGIMSERADDEPFARAIGHVAVLRTRCSEKSHYLEQL